MKAKKGTARAETWQPYCFRSSAIVVGI